MLSFSKLMNLTRLFLLLLLLYFKFFKSLSEDDDENYANKFMHTQYIYIFIFYMHIDIFQNYYLIILIIFQEYNNKNVCIYRERKKKL